MTDTRLPDRWLADPNMDRLSDKDWRVFTSALMYCNRYGTDGAINQFHFKFLQPVDKPDQSLTNLVEAGLAEWEGTQFQFKNWSTDLGQSTAEYIRRKRAENAQKSRNKRALRKSVSVGDVPRDVPRDVPGDVPGDVPRDVGQVRTGKDRKGKDSMRLTDQSRNSEHLNNLHPVTEWAVAQPGGTAIITQPINPDDEPF